MSGKTTKERRQILIYVTVSC